MFHEEDESESEEEDAEPQHWGAGGGNRRQRSGTLSATSAIDIVRSGSIGCTEEELLRK